MRRQGVGIPRAAVGDVLCCSLPTAAASSLFSFPTFYSIITPTPSSSPFTSFFLLLIPCLFFLFFLGIRYFWCFFFSLTHWEGMDEHPNANLVSLDMRSKRIDLLIYGRKNIHQIVIVILFYSFNQFFYMIEWELINCFLCLSMYRCPYLWNSGTPHSFYN